MVKKVVKITKEQYNRIFVTKLLNENYSIGSESKTIELIKYFYGKTNLFPSFLSEKDFTNDEICEYFLNKGLIILKNGGYEIPKSIGEPQDVIQQFDKALDEILIDNQETVIDELETENFLELNHPLSVVDSNDEISILTDGINQFVFNYSDVSSEPLSDEEVNEYMISSGIKVGYGVDSWLNGASILTQIDDELREKLKLIYNHDLIILNAISDEVEPTVGPIEGNKIIAKLKQLKAQNEPIEIDEMTSAGASSTGGSSGPFTAPLNLSNGDEDESIIRKTTPIVAEMTDTSSNNTYDANALPGISRDGSFKKTKKTKAQEKTQWAGGGFVEFNDCTKLNNKTAGSGCSGGAVDNVVSVKKTNGNINAPSLNENEILKIIAKKTGRNIDEIKVIIDSKKTIG